MDLREFLSINSLRSNADIILSRIEEDPQLFDTVWDILFEDSHPLSMRAGRVIYLFAQKHPHFLEPRIRAIVGSLPFIKTESVMRNLLGILCLLSIPADHAGFLFDFCYNIAASTKSPVAHKAYAFTILYNISEMEPDLKPELISLFESQLDTKSAGIKSRIKNLLKKLYREV